MIGKPLKKKEGSKSSFRKLVNYATNPKVRSQEREQSQLPFDDVMSSRVLYTNSQHIENPDNAYLEMEALASLNTLCKDPVYHFVLSWREHEFPTNEQADEAVSIALNELGLNDCQAIWGLQADTNNRHVHVAVNRIDPETLRATRPDNGWDIKALERASRKIEIAQGWEIEQTGLYSVTDEGEVTLKREMKEDQEKLSQKARTIEAHTGEQSAEQMGKKIATPIIQNANSWEELHSKLAEQGIRYEKKGSGAVLWINDTAVRASQINKEFSMSKLQERLGNYQARDNNITVSKLELENSQPVERIAQNPKIKATWSDYQDAQRKYKKDKDKASIELKKRQKEERDSLKEQQKKARNELLKEKNWQGKGNELNTRRSFLAAEQQKEQLDLRDRQREEYKKLKDKFPQRFPNFKTWLETGDQWIGAMLQNPEQLVFSGDDKKSQNLFAGDLRNYTGEIGNRGSVAYFSQNKEQQQREAAFIDYGRKIVLSKDPKEEAILAAFQLASQKWGAIEINGTDEYKKMCVELAAKHGFKIANPDLRAEVEKIKASEQEIKEKDQEMKRREREENARKLKIIEQSRVNLFEQYADAVGAERFRILATEFTPDGVKAFILDKKEDGLNGKTRDGIAASMPKLNSYIKYNKNINVVPMSNDKHHIVIDDITADKLLELKKDGYAPACVIESSPGNLQAILTIPKLGVNEIAEREAANYLTKELNQKYGDPKLFGAVHAHRLPPFPNYKPQHRREDGTYPETSLIESTGGFCQKGIEHLTKIHQVLEDRKRKQQEAAAAYISVPRHVREGANDPHGAYWAHYEDVMNRAKGTVDYSAIDSRIGTRMRVTGYSQSQIYDAIKDNAPAMRKKTMGDTEFTAKYQHRDWNRFARETTEKYVFGARGENQYRQAESYRMYYLRLEGRQQQQQQEPQNKKNKDLGR